MMNTTLSLLLALGVLGPFAAATPAGALAAPPCTLAQDDVGARATALVAQYDAAFDAYLDARDDAYAAYLEARKTDPKAGLTMPATPDADFYPRMAALAAEGSPLARAWCVEHFSSAAEGAARTSEFVSLVIDALANPAESSERIVNGLQNQGRMRGGVDRITVRSLLRAAEFALPERAQAARAGFLQAGMLAGEEQLAELRRVAAAYPDTRDGERAGATLFEREHLVIGAIAPEVTGADVDGNPMKLSDLRGKVVVLDFWGFW